MLVKHPISTLIALGLTGTVRASSVEYFTPLPRTITGYLDTALPDPFMFTDGSPVTSLAGWELRRTELISLIQGYEAGYLPPRPPVVYGSFSNGTLAVTAGGVDGFSDTVTWASPITYPNGTAPPGGWPLLIGYDGGSIPVPNGVALLNFNTTNMAQQYSTASRGLGLFYELYGANASASALTAWTWGVSRVIDVLEVTPEAMIDMSKIAITGCSRDGKGALTTGAFEPRIALTIAQESGSGGAACWRLSLYEQEMGAVVQTATEIVTENVWFSTNFNNYVYDLPDLPFDHHLLAALIAPRGLLALDNTDFVWLSPVSNYGCMSAARMAYQALGVEYNLGFMQQGGHPHCMFPTNQTTFLDNFFDKFLLGQPDADTNVFLTNNVWNGVPWVASNWTNWTVPMLY